MITTGRKPKWKKTQAQYAREIGISHKFLNNVLNGKARCSIELAFKIEEATEGRIKATTLRKDLKEIARQLIKTTI